MAVSPPANTPAATAPTVSESITAESLGWQLRAALPPLRLHSVSLYDEQANVLWLSEGALGPDEHNLVLEAMEKLADDKALPRCENSLEDGRAAIFLPVRAPQGDLVGIAMILTDLKSVSDGVLERIVSPQLRTIMQKIAVLLRSTSKPARPTVPAAPVIASVPPAPVKLAAPSPAVPPASAAAEDSPSLSPQAIDDMLEFELLPIVTAATSRENVATVESPAEPSQPTAAHARETPGVKLELLSDNPSTQQDVTKPTVAAVATGATTTSAKLTGSTTTSKALASSGTSRILSVDPTSVTLDVHPFTKLRAGGRMRRYEVLPRIHRDVNRHPAALDWVTLQRLLSWLGSNRPAWTVEPTCFSLNLSISTLEDERFLQQVASCLKSNGITPHSLGFEIAEPLCTQRRAQVERFITLCEKLGCFVVIDDFSFDSSVLPLLRSKALRLVKIDPKLTAAALRDKLSQAMVVAIVQAVKVLGIHCAAKGVESQASLQWLTAIGCDLAQGPVLSQALPIESLNITP